MRLSERTVLITGGTAGIGLAFARKLLELGNEVIVTGRRKALIDEVKEKHPRLQVMQSDVADPAQIAALAAEVKARFPALDVLMNNAGIMRYQNLATPSANLAGLTTEMETNVGGVIRTTAAFIDTLCANQGTVINVSSALAFVPLPCNPIYSATKAAIHSFTQSLRFQLEDRGVEVIELMPPAVKTEMMTGVGDEGGALMEPDELVERCFRALKAGAREVRPGQANALAFMRRLAPELIGKQLWKAAKPRVPSAP